MVPLIKYLQREGFETVACCCGHGKYHMSIIVRFHKRLVRPIYQEILSSTNIPRTRNFYKRDKQGHYYIPEVWC